MAPCTRAPLASRGSSPTAGRPLDEAVSDALLRMLSRRVTAPAGVRVSGRGANGLLRGEYGCPGAWWPARAAASLGVGAAEEVMLTRALGCTFSLLSGSGGLRGESRRVRALGTPQYVLGCKLP